MARKSDWGKTLRSITKSSVKVLKVKEKKKRKKPFYEELKGFKYKHFPKRKQSIYG